MNKKRIISSIAIAMMGMALAFCCKMKGNQGEYELVIPEAPKQNVIANMDEATFAEAQGREGQANCSPSMKYVNGEWKAMTSSGSVDSSYTGMAYNEIGWFYFRNGQLDWTYTGMACNDYGWWYFSNGDVVYNYTGMACNDYGWWYFRDGAIDFNYTGMAWNEYGWWYFRNGAIDFNYTGMACNEVGWFYYKNGQIDFHYTGMACNDYGWWYFQNGAINFDYTGMACNDYGWWYFRNGSIDFGYTGMAWNEYGWWYFRNGAIDFNYTGMAQNENGWFYYVNGQIDFHYTGIGQNENGYWYYYNGGIAFGYTGEYTAKDGQVYNVTNGHAVKKNMSRVKVNRGDTLQLGIFMNSTSDATDTLYVSFNGYDFYSIGEAYKDATPNSSASDETVDSAVLRDYTGVSTVVENSLHDPSILYRDGYFWAMSGYTAGGKFFPMLGYSNDLTNWSYPASGDGWVGLSPTVLPYNRDGKRTNTNFDVAAPDFMVDDDGSVWIVACLGYYGDFHGEGPETDKLSPYLVHVTGMSGMAEDLTTPAGRVTNPVLTYGELVPINLPDTCDNRIDASLYKENGVYYLCIKRDGVTNEIWKINNLADCQNSASWTKVCDDVITGYEGPSLSKFGGYYFCYTDKLADYPAENPDGTTGIFVATSKQLGRDWSANLRITTRDKSGNAIPTRHGTVITLTDPTAIEMVMQKYQAAGY